MKVISAPRLLVGGRLTGPASVVVENGRVSEIRSTPPLAANEHIQLAEGVLTAGLVDIQVNGSFGVDLAGADQAGWAHVATCLPAHGVTAFQATFITAPVATLAAGLRSAAGIRRHLGQPGHARVLGIHLEGPFLSPKRHGVHDPTLMMPPTTPDLDTLLTATPDEHTLTMVTLAPEHDGGIEAVRRLADAGVVVSVGHSDATAAQARAAADAGATMITHIFNAQRGLAHREPGVAGQALDDPRFYVGLIPDLLHVSPTVCRLVMTVAGGRVALVSDAMAAAGMPPGRYQLGGQMIEVTDEGLPRNADGTIAGSSLCLDQGVRNLVDSGCEQDAVLDAATRVPADVLGREDLGRLAPGAHADLVWWSDDLHVRRTWIGGELAYDAARQSAVTTISR